MKRLILFCAALIGSGIAVPNFVFCSEKTTEALDNSKSQVPVPYQRKIAHFMRTYRGELDAQLSVHDRALLISTIRKYSWYTGAKEVLDVVRVQNTLCQMVTEGYSETAIVDELVRFEELDDQIYESYFEDFTNGLSAAGAMTVNNHLDRMSHSIGYSKLDTEAVLANRPGVILGNLSNRCEEPRIIGELLLEVSTGETVKTIKRSIQ